MLAIADELTEDGFVLRYRTDETDDGLSGKEGSFLICSFWLVSALAIVGEEQRARDLMERLLRVASPLGLYAEEFDVDTGRHLGNFPQAFSHLALIEAAARISHRRAGATSSPDRGGRAQPGGRLRPDVAEPALRTRASRRWIATAAAGNTRTESTPAPTRAAAFSGSMVPVARPICAEGHQHRKRGRGQEHQLHPLRQRQHRPVDQSVGNPRTTSSRTKNRMSRAGASTIDRRSSPIPDATKNTGMKKP